MRMTCLVWLRTELNWMQVRIAELAAASALYHPLCWHPKIRQSGNECDLLF